MAHSEKDVFEPHFFLSHFFASGFWRGAAVDITRADGYRVTDGRPHYRLDDDRPHYTLFDQRPHYRVIE